MPEADRSLIGPCHSSQPATHPGRPGSSGPAASSHSAGRTVRPAEESDEDRRGLPEGWASIRPSSPAAQTPIPKRPGTHWPPSSPADSGGSAGHSRSPYMPPSTARAIPVVDPAYGPAR